MRQATQWHSLRAWHSRQGWNSDVKLLVGGASMAITYFDSHMVNSLVLGTERPFYSPGVFINHHAGRSNRQSIGHGISIRINRTERVDIPSVVDDRCGSGSNTR